GAPRRRAAAGGRGVEDDGGAGAPGPGTDVVAVASSTGGVWVLAALLRELPRDGRAVLVAQHMEPEFVPFFADWLQSASGWRTVLVQDATPLAPGAVYLPGGGRDLVLDREVLRAMPASSRFVPCADRLLASAAERGGRATGVVLSGMGGDGAGGLAEIARRGGRALCQAPASAVVPSMPESALRRTPSALALPPPALPGAIAAQPPETSGASARR
ncbi:MAG TPA: chemotaxis protein CheB, partial [Anaeromyxobacter sp.]